MRSLKTTLSIATELARTPAPVYGMPASSRKPCSVPSSPYGPWTTRKATSIASASDRTALRAASAPARAGGRAPAPRRATAGARPPRRRRRAQQPGQALTALELRRRAAGQDPATLAVDVDEVGLVPIAVDGAQDRLGRGDADLVLGRAPAREDPDPQPLGHGATFAQSPTNSISYSSSTPNRSATTARTCSPSGAHVGGATAATLGHDEVRVERADPRLPMRWPFRPATSMSRPA
jgi:hypothetical protein